MIGTGRHCRPPSLPEAEARCVPAAPPCASFASPQDKFGKGVGLSLAAVRSYTKQVRGALLLLLLRRGRSVTARLFPHPIARFSWPSRSWQSCASSTPTSSERRRVGEAASPSPASLLLYLTPLLMCCCFFTPILPSPPLMQAAQRARERPLLDRQARRLRQQLPGGRSGAQR